MKSSESNLKLSVIIPTYNKCSYLDKLLASLLNQNFDSASYEVIIVNDGSTDATEKVIARYHPLFLNIHTVYQENRGIGAARNAGIRCSRGELIAFLADDYVLIPTYFSDLVATFKDQNLVGIRADLGSIGNSIVEKIRLNQTRLRLWHCLYDGNPPLRFPGMKLIFPSVVTAFKTPLEWAGGAMMRRWVFEKYGLFREDLSTGEDTEFGLRLAVNGVMIHFYPKRLLHVAFRREYKDSLRRYYEYMANGTIIGEEVVDAKRPRRGLGEKLSSFTRSTIELLCMAESFREALKMLPYVFLNRIVTLAGFFGGKTRFSRCKTARHP